MRWTNAPAAGYETLDGRLSIVSAQDLKTGSGSQQPLAVLAVARPVDRQLLGTIGSYAGVRVAPAPRGVADTFILATTPAPASNGVLNQFGEAFTQGAERSAYLGVYDADGYRSGLVKVSTERSAITRAAVAIRSVAVAALVVALAAAVIAALLVSRPISTPLPRTGHGRGGHGRRRDQARDPRERQGRGRAACGGVQHDVPDK